MMKLFLLLLGFSVLVESTTTPAATQAATTPAATTPAATTQAATQAATTAAAQVQDVCAAKACTNPTPYCNLYTDTLAACEKIKVWRFTSADDTKSLFQDPSANGEGVQCNQDKNVLCSYMNADKYCFGETDDGIVPAVAGTCKSSDDSRYVAGIFDEKTSKKIDFTIKFRDISQSDVESFYDQLKSIISLRIIEDSEYIIPVSKITVEVKDGNWDDSEKNCNLEKNLGHIVSFRVEALNNKVAPVIMNLNKFIAMNRTGGNRSTGVIPLFEKALDDFVTQDGKSTKLKDVLPDMCEPAHIFRPKAADKTAWEKLSELLDVTLIVTTALLFFVSGMFLLFLEFCSARCKAKCGFCSCCFCCFGATEKKRRRRESIQAEQASLRGEEVGLEEGTEKGNRASAICDEAGYGDKIEEKGTDDDRGKK